MSKIVLDAIYQDGVLKPVEPLDLPENMPLRVTIEPATRETCNRLAGLLTAKPEGAADHMQWFRDRISLRIESPERGRFLHAAFVALTVLLGGWLLALVAMLLQGGSPGQLEGLWRAVQALRLLTRAHLKGLSLLIPGAALVIALIWLRQRGKKGLVPAAFLLSLGLAIAGETLVLQRLFIHAAVLFLGAAVILIAGLLLSRGRLGDALGPVAWSRRREWLLLLLVLAIALFTRFYLLGLVPYGVEGDESSWALQVAETLARTDGQRPYPFSLMPTSFWMQEIFYHLFGISIVTARWEVALFSVVATILFYVALREMINIPVALIATYLLGISLVDLAASRQAHVETHVKIWIMLAIFGMFLGYRRRQPLLFVLAGISLALGLMVYDSFALTPAALFTYAFYRLVRERHDWRQHLLYIVSMLLPVVIVAPGVWRYLEGRRISQVTVLYHAVGIFPDSFQNILRVLHRLPGFMLKYASTTLEVLAYQQRQDVLIGRRGPLESAALVPLLFLGFVIVAWCWRRSQAVFALFWLLVPGLPTALVLGQPYARTFYPFLGAFLILAAAALWVLYHAFREDLRGHLRWGPTIALVLFLGLLGLSNTYVYFNEVRDPPDRQMRRELGDLLISQIAPGEMVYLPYLPLHEDFLEIEWRYPRFVVRNQIPPDTEAQYYRAIPYADLLKDISASRERLTGVKVFYDKTISHPGVRQQVLEAFKRCYPQHMVQRGRFFDVYIVTAEGLAAARCYSDAQITLISPRADQEIAANATPHFTWQVQEGGQTAFRLELERHNDQIIWVEAEEFSQDNGWQAQAHLATGFSGRAYLADVTPSNAIAARHILELPQAGRYEIWVRSYRRVDDNSPVFLNVAGLSLEVGRPEAAQLNRWRWESLGWHELPGGSQEFAFTRRFGGGPHWQIFIDALVLSRQAGFDPNRQSDWETMLDTGEIVSSQGEYLLLQPLAPGRYRWRVKVIDGDRLVGWAGSLGAASAYSHFRVSGQRGLPSSSQQRN